ncbi:CDP-2,3-bis-(O-geranylgeranyl)-sn-glycerol synthase [Candidatus Bathyarchaeota archaeon]|nr:CDP-2,3-bis-(O-geranylgeranyl)-sn-glycerol synthase [Candidatus Bathyarchaeota archaeon]
MIDFDALTMFQALYYILPAYVANAVPTVFGGGSQIDFGRNFIDGRPLFGPHKTIRGFFSGLIAGVIIGFLQGTIVLGFLLSIGALIGDLVGAFAKRRLSIPSGYPFPVFDQLGFVVAALIFGSFLLPLEWPKIFFVLFFTPIIHVSTNAFAYFLKIKDDPW